jgi:hypothetical protein
MLGSYGSDEYNATGGMIFKDSSVMQLNDNQLNHNTSRNSNFGHT